LPLALLFVPIQDFMIQLVGFRGNAFLLLFLLIGANASEEDIRDIGLALCVLNVGALAFAAGEFFFGIDRFMPYSAVTDLIYTSHDVGSMGAYRIPATFVNAHSYGGQMVLSLPLIIGTWSQPRRKVWHGPLIVAGIFSAVIGVFLSAARIHFVALLILAVVFSVSSKIRGSQRLAWVVVVVAVGYLVSGHERMQRFETLQDKEMVVSRIEGSVNASFWDALTQYPMGNGLGGGGTSIPYFLYDRLRAPLIIESEYARIQLEMGVFGLVLWICFFVWIFTRPKPHISDTWYVGRRLGWTACALFCAMGMIGTGLLTGIPCSALLLLMLGWVAVPRPNSQRRLTSSNVRYQHPQAPKLAIYRPVPGGVTVR
jgi:hypothetical protein